MGRKKKITTELPDKLRDHNGDMVPVKYIPEHDLKRHKAVSEIIKKAKELEAQISEFKTFAVGTSDEFISEMIVESGLDETKFKGNITLYNFDRSEQVEVNSHEFISFNERIGIARGLINECLEEWTKGSKKEISVLVSKAFKTDKRGFLDTKRIIELLSYEINDEKWQKAMEIIKESITVSHRKKYYSFRIKNDKGDWARIVLDFSGAETTASQNEYRNSHR